LSRREVRVGRSNPLFQFFYIESNILLHLISPPSVL
jgi:hypothetical protein